MYHLEERLWTTHDGSRLAKPGDSPIILLGNKGSSIPESRARALGLIKAMAPAENKMAAPAEVKAPAAVEVKAPRRGRAK